MQAFIDEAGDGGVGRGSRWLVFGLVMLADAAVTPTRQNIQALRTELGKPYLHFRKLNHDQKLTVAARYNKADWLGCSLLRETKGFRSPVGNAPLYWCMVAFLIERVSWRAEQLGERAIVYIEPGRQYINERNLEEFRQFMNNQINNGTYNVNFSCVPVDEGVRLVGQISEPIMDIADGLAHAGFSAFELGRTSGRTEPAYYGEFLPKLWGRNPTDGVNLYDNGLLLRPRFKQNAFVEEYG